MKSAINISSVYFLVIGIFLFFSFAISCDNSIDPIDKETGIYSVYGVLDLNEQTNYIRVRDLNVPFTAEATREIDAEVTLGNLQTDLAKVLESERQKYEDIYLHNFIYKSEVIPETEYRLTVERSDGAAVNITVTTPTKPAPQASPLNQNCYIPIDFELSPLNGSTVVLRVGLPPDYENGEDEEDWSWGRKHVFKSDDHQSPGKAIFTFTPQEQIIEIIRASNIDRRCKEHLHDGNIHISYIHYGPGFYERISEESFDIFRSAQRFGALYYDTLAIPVDTNSVCPQDC